MFAQMRAEVMDGVGIRTQLFTRVGHCGMCYGNVGLLWQLRFGGRAVAVMRGVGKVAAHSNSLASDWLAEAGTVFRLTKLNG